MISKARACDNVEVTHVTTNGINVNLVALREYLIHQISVRVSVYQRLLKRIKNAIAFGLRVVLMVVAMSRSKNGKKRTL